jgi:hypothetical protein
MWKLFKRLFGKPASGDSPLHDYDTSGGLRSSADGAPVLPETMESTDPTYGGNDFFPPEYKTFPFAEGDLLVSQRSEGEFAVNKVLKIDKVILQKGDTIHIQSNPFTAPVEDYLLIVSVSYGEPEFDSLEQARRAAESGKWRVRVGHVPNRAPGSAEGQTKIGTAPVTEAELEGYRGWKLAFDKGEAGVF